MQRRYVVLDVFTDRAFAGNPLAVVLDGAGLDDAQMQTVAGEFNLSETVFVTSFNENGPAADIRIFTPSQELPFAGHPTVGTATLLVREHLKSTGQTAAATAAVTHTIVLNEAVGPVHCQVKLEESAPHATFGLPRMPEFVGECGPVEDIAAALGLAIEDIGFDNHRPAQWSAGVPFSMVPIASLEAVGNIQAATEAWAKAFGEGHHNNAYVYCRQCVDGKNQFHARMFWPGAGVSEDPATGGAAAAFSGVLVKYEDISDGEHMFVIEQGFEMGRPSLIGLTLHMQNGALNSVQIGGNAVEVARGTIEI